MQRYLRFDPHDFHAIMAMKDAIDEVDDVSHIRYDEKTHRYIIQGERRASAKRSYPITVTQVFNRAEITHVFREVGLIEEQESVSSVSMINNETQDQSAGDSKPKIKVVVTENEIVEEMRRRRLTLEVSETEHTMTNQEKRRRKMLFTALFLLITFIGFNILRVLA